MLSGMKTTISLDAAVRDRLASLAVRHGRTMGEQIVVMIEAAEEQEFWVNVSAGYADIAAGGVEIVVHDDYPEYAHLRVEPVAAEGGHNAPDTPPTRGRRVAA